MLSCSIWFSAPSFRMGGGPESCCISRTHDLRSGSQGHLSYLLTYLLIPWCRVLLEKLVTKFPALHGTRRFITALTSVRQLSPSWSSPIQSIYPHLTSWRSILILSTHLRLGLLLLKTTAHPKTRCRKPYAATQHPMLLMMGVCTRNMLS